MTPRYTLRVDATKEMLIDHECGRLVTAYCCFVDNAEAVALAALFTTDGIWQAGELEMVGQEALEQGFGIQFAAGDGLSRHVCNNFRCTIIDPDHALGITTVTLYHHEPDSEGRPTPNATLVMLGEYRDHFRRTDSGWRISKREIGVRFEPLKPPIG